jgi:hypothetical protein
MLRERPDSPPLPERPVVLAQGATRDLDELRAVLERAGVAAWVTTPPGKNVNC